MKKIIILLVACLGASQLFSQTLFSYGPFTVSKDEFLRAYNKNKTPVTNKEQSLKEYLDLYAKFKLKVKIAQQMKLDTLQQQVYDLQNFRSQVAEGYMNDQKGLNTLVEEAIERSRKDIHLLHFYVPFTSGMSNADSGKAYNAMNELAGELKEGKTNYPALVQEISKKYLDTKWKDLGYITTFSVPYDIETLVYNLKPGCISKLYRTRSGLHIIKNADERKSAGKWKIAQVLLSVPPNATAAEIKSIEAKADSVYTLAIGGADFALLAKQFSEDKLTFANGGEMPEFGTGKFDLPFESKVFELKKDGEISRPIFTGYGFHIVKRLHQQNSPVDKNDEAFVTALKQQITQDSRINAVKADFLKIVKTKTGYKRNAAIKDTDLFRFADSVAIAREVGNYPINNKTIFSFLKLNVKGSDWLNFVKDYKLNTDVYKGENNKALLDKYIATTSFEYYRKHLEEYDTEFKYQIQEFKEGNMLFEIMERNVWGKAGNDSVGLLQYYNSHKMNYKWAASADILLLNSSDKNVVETAVAGLQTGKNWKRLAEESNGKLQVDSGRYELSQLQLPQGTVITEGLISKPYPAGDNITGFIKVLKMFPANQQRTFDEARGLVINDYQTYLEEKWIEELKRKYPIKVNDAVFGALLH